jgi:hypothetical protein
MGIPIAFINIVGTNGYQKIEVWNSEMFTIGGTFKLGVPKFYTSFNIGYHFTNQYEIGTGFGIGTNFQMKEKTTLAVELTNWNLFDDRLFESNSFTDLSQFKVMFNYDVNERVGIFGGPSINFLYSDSKAIANDAAPNWSTKAFGNEKLRMWFGFQAGMRFL